jgi:general secretion pathway protein C
MLLSKLMQKRRHVIRQVVIVFYMAGAAFFLSHSINAYVEQQLVLVPLSPPAVSLPDQPAAPAVPAEQLAEAIKRSRLFSSPVEIDVTGLATTSTPGKPKGPPLDVKKKLRLLGTSIGAGGGWSAVIEEFASKHQALFHLHDMIPDIGEVAEIRTDGVVIRRDEQEELLQPAILEQETPGHASPPSAVPATFAPVSRRILDRRQVTEATSNMSKLLAQAHAVPHLGPDGMIDGFRLDFVAPASFFEKVGLQYGDLLQRVNGVATKDPGSLWTLFQHLKDERIVKLDLVRNSQPTTLTYELR